MKGLRSFQLKGRLDYGIIKVSIICFRVYFKICRERKREAKATINHILNMSNITDEMFEEAVANLKSHARIALHFHPDRLDSNMRNIAEALLEQGRYKVSLKHCYLTEAYLLILAVNVTFGKREYLEAHISLRA